MDQGPARTSTEVTCTECGKPANVPFTPTPGRPVFCRDCFQKRAGGPGGAGGARRPPPRQSGYGGGYPSGPAPQSGGFRAGPRQDSRPSGPNQRKRMLAQGRKTHFIYDARALLRRTEGGMDDQHHRAFLEGLFARGARDSTAAARDFLDEKLADQTLTADEHRGLSDLIERYSFWR